jgi:heat shock protein HtpX
MEMCIDNPRVGFANVFDTHPPVEARVEALVKFAGGHDPGPLALEAPEPQRQVTDQSDAENADAGPWGDAPQEPARQSGPWGPEPGAPTGPWGPKQN